MDRDLVVRARAGDRADAPIGSSPAVVGERTFVLSNDGVVPALDPKRERSSGRSSSGRPRARQARWSSQDWSSPVTIRGWSMPSTRRDDDRRRTQPCAPAGL